MELPEDGAVGKAVAVLKALRDARDGSSARTLAARTGLPRSTVQRTLTTLTATGMVEQDADRRYRIGPQALLIGLGYRQGVSLVSAARPLMVGLRDATGETVGLSIRSGRSRVFIEEVQSTLPLRFASELGVLYPLWSGATGRILMLDLPATELEEVLADRTGSERLHRALPAQEARELLERARLDGHAVADDETIADVRSLAVAVRSAPGEVTAALSVSGPSTRLRVRDAEVLARLDETAQRLGRLLGHPS